MLDRSSNHRRSGSGTSTWSRKSLKRAMTAPAPPHDPPPSAVSDDEHAIGDDDGKAVHGDDILWTTVPPPALHVHYKLHNPTGPRYYRNHHLIPPSHLQPSMRPPTFFSPSFPPIGASSSPSLDDTPPPPSRTPSHSPLPTPSSSQTRVQDGGKPRSRKTSQTTPDAVDLLDVTDPWGTNWHHQSPYEFGQPPIVNSIDLYEKPQRPRRASMGALQGHSSVAPSPLSQSTSAIHLNAPRPEIHIPRKLSKRKPPAVADVFPSSPPAEPERKAFSAPPTPIEHLDVSHPPAVTTYSDTNVLPKRMSVAPAPLSTPFNMAPPQPPTSKKEKRGSMLNRIVKKFSVLKRSTDPGSSGIDMWNYAEVQKANGYPYGSTLASGSSSPEKVLPDPMKRVRPPSVHSPVEVKPEPSTPPPQPSKRDSIDSVDIPFPVARLTIANPDLSDEKDEPEPDSPPVPLPKTDAEEPDTTDLASLAGPDRLQSPLPNSRLLVDKPLPPQLATPVFSHLQLAMSDITVSTPRDIEMPPLPHPKEDPQKELPSPVDLSEPPVPPDKPKYTDFSFINSPAPNASISLDHVINDFVSPSPAPAPNLHRSPTRRSSQKEKEKSPADDVLPERGHSESPPKKTSIRRQSPVPSQKDPATNAIAAKVRNSHERTPTEGNSTLRREVTGESSGSSHRHHSKKASSRPNLRAQEEDTTTTSKPVSYTVPLRTEEDDRPQNDVDMSQAAYADSPWSTSSMLANPPTPYDHRLSLAISEQSTPPTVPPKSLYEEKITRPQEQQRTPTRQTETFRLVRSSSGNVYASGQTILAQGQQWEVVESIEARGRKEKGSRSKDDDRRSDDRDLSWELQREAESRKARELEREREREKKREAEKREAEIEIERHKARERERERERARERERELEREKERRELEKEREWARERERQRERDKQKAFEAERAREREREEAEKAREASERERIRSKEKARDREREREKERAREKERERERRRDHDSRRNEQSDRRSRDNARKSRDHDLRTSEYERTTKGHDSRRQESGHASQDYSYSSKDHDRRDKPRAEMEVVDVRHYTHRPSRSSHQPANSSKQSSDRNGHRPEEEPLPNDDSRGDRRRRDTRRTDVQATADQLYNNIHQQPPASAPKLTVQQESSPPPRARLERNPSLSGRPISQLASADEMNAVRAKESWEMERLWKARSLYGMEPNATTRNVIPGTRSSSSFSDDQSTAEPQIVYGSSHTSYVVQTPFHHGSQIYHSMPTGPPPIIYSSPASIPSIPDLLSNYDPNEHSRSYYYAPSLDDHKISPQPPQPPPKLSNPLPEPPRESSYEPADLTAIRHGKKITTEYWKYNGITTGR